MKGACGLVDQSYKIHAQRVESSFCSQEYENGLLFSISIVSTPSTVLSIKTKQNLSPFPAIVAKRRTSRYPCLKNRKVGTV